MRDQIITQLFSLADRDYAAFHQRTCPNTGEMIGVRVPLLRKIANGISQADSRQFLAECQNAYYEETFLEGLVIATSKIPLHERLAYTRNFLPQIKNWAVCDCFCCSFKIKTDEKPEVWRFICEFWDAEDEFLVRFFLVMSLAHFLETEYLPEIFATLKQKHPDLQYINMAKAWLIAEIMVNFREPVIELLKEQILPPKIQNKAIQKIRESYRISDADKALVQKFRIKN